MDDLSKVTPEEVVASIKKQTAELTTAADMRAVLVSETHNALDNALSALKHNKPNDRSDKDRYWAIVITDVEKAIAVFETYVMLK
jgi:hypothetical protein